ncbi:amidohydrolase [Francisella adeliensis]|uniref:Amidohydrolase n=1 Tax=Francisella adeliensis TaxID=2007306 RepID=A0A2Z4XYC9_9GAMM|nr:amidohydrolase [Francisella adeliensis]AXA33754.1 amidohydrolase [Francisella adeliensis]MBK2085652.1 amidohydrolase [Francisella adeliensis]MBK2097530.1 amidohydrolase [Francisella adeliensis]QIW11989.1 amidohydrolase [Francisella adeliensis]QIW13864.1 amidohydrolase [Francisella adeliensis]
MKKITIFTICILSFFKCFADAKVKASIIIKNGLILTMDKDYKIINDGVVVISGTKIVAVGNKNLINKYKAEQTIDAQNGIVMPGMINAHTHAGMSLFRSAGDDVADRLTKYLFPLEAKLVTPKLVYDATLNSAIEMVKGGVTTMVDMYYFEDYAAKAVKTIGMRGVMGETIMGNPTPDSKKPYGGIEYANKFLIPKYKNDHLITPAYAPHAPYTNDTKHLREVEKLSKQQDVPITIHLSETKAELEKYKKEYNKTPVEYLESIGLLSNRLIAAHCIFVTDKDIQIMKENGVGVSHNPIANSKSAKGIAPVLEMDKENIKLGLGTDGPMSSNSLDIINQMSYVTTLQKLKHSDRTIMPAKDVVEMATIGGAKAIHMDDKVGSLEKGKLADIAIIETKSANMNPIYDPYSVLVYSAYPLNVDTVIINGKLIVKNKKLLTFSESQNQKTVESYSKKVKKILDKLDNK